MKKAKTKKKTGPDQQKIPANPAKDDLLVVGIGASAGGVQALKTFFEHVPANSGIAYIVILHLSPDHDSKLAELLQTSANIPVMQVREQVTVQPDHVYVVPPNQHLMMADGVLAVSQNTLLEERRAPVDIFFRTLAESHQSRAVAVILSGTGANGSMGLKRIKEQGGAAFVQNPREAEFNEMPRNSIATELVDDVLPVADIPAKIIAYKQSLGTVEIPAETENRPEEQQQALREIFTQLRFRTGHDFSNYKRPTLLRRIERRINVRSLPNLAAYAGFVQQNPEETQALLKDLLISVTNFFRDKKAFEHIEQDIFPRMLQNKRADEALRIWVIGCATGEEAYSLAMLCAEKTMGVIEAPKIQIFATDLDETAIATARDGLYTINDAADVSQERLRRFFVKEGDNYRIRREIREMVLFATHNVLKDPPFSHLDLVSCRNMLIYLNSTAQERVLETVHFALNPGGYLFLGTSESADSANDLYLPVSRENHIYQARHVAARSYPVPETTPAFHHEKKQSPITIPEMESRAIGRLTYADLHQQLLEQYAPPSVVVNEEYEILHLSERAGRYLQLAGGEPSQNLLKLVRPELRLELRTALYQAKQRQTNVKAGNLKLRIEDHTETINIHVRPVLREGDTARGFMLVLFEQSTDTGEKTDAEKVFTSDEPVARHLEEELIRAKTQLRTTIEQHELQSEELKASNEELQAMNEELRSAAEELETSKEELQSINEELTTVNQELKVKIEETSLSNNNFENLINSTDIATVFLDRSFRVNLFTPAARTIFNLIPADFGRPVSDITHRLLYTELLDDAEFVLQKLQPVEREVKTKNGFSFIMRVLPYRTHEDHINGVVITFVDVSDRKRTEELLQASETDFRASFEISSVGKILGNPETGRMERVNQALCRLLGYDETELLERNIWDIMHPDEMGPPQPGIDRPITDYRAEKRYQRKDGVTIWADVSLNLIRDKKGQPVRFVAVVQDITERKHAEEALRDSRERLRVTMESATEYAIITIDNAGIIQAWNSGAQRIFGYTEPEVIGKPGHIIFTPEDRMASVPENEMKQAREEGRAIDERWHLRKNGSRFYMSGVMSPIRSNVITGYVKVARDMTAYKQAEEILRISEERYRIALQAAEMGAWDWNVTDDIILWNEQHYLLLGLPPGTGEKNLPSFLEYVHEEDRKKIELALDKAVNETGLYHAEFRIVRADNQQHRWMNGYGRSVASENGRASRIVGVMYDVTDRKKLEQQKDEFIGIASHELKTPVTSIKAYVEILQEMLHEAKTENHTELVQKLNVQVDRLTRLIASLLDTTKISEGQLILRPQRFILNELVEERVEELKNISPNHRLVIQADSTLTITADRDRIGQALTNILSNAVKYSPNGGDISISCEQVNNMVKVGVRDNGIGIAEDKQKKIFERFFRLRDTKEHLLPGMGLGLYITAGIIHGHGGNIWVESKPGAGSAFYFTLPLDK